MMILTKFVEQAAYKTRLVKKCVCFKDNAHYKTLNSPESVYKLELLNFDDFFAPAI